MKILVELPRSKILGKESFCAHEVSEVLKTTGGSSVGHCSQAKSRLAKVAKSVGFSTV
jgi:hypothetical protein